MKKKIISKKNQSKLIMKYMEEKRPKDITFQIDMSNQLLSSYPFEDVSQLIPKKDYFDFLYNQKNRVECQIKALKIQYREIKNFNPSMYKNKWISSFLKLALSPKYKESFNTLRLQLLMNNYISFDLTSKMIKQIIDKINKNVLMDDKMIMEDILNSPYEDLITKDFHKIEGECTHWEFMIDNIFQALQKFKHPNQTKLFKYLDVGCLNGDKTILFSKILNIPLSSTHGVNIPLLYKNFKDYKYPFEYKNTNGYQIPYPDNSFDIITSFTFLYQIPNLTEMMKEIKRVLKPNGIFIFVDYDVQDMFDTMILNIDTIFHQYLNEKNINYLENPLSTRYMNYMEWDFILNKFHMKYLKAGALFLSGTYHYFEYKYLIFKIVQNIK